MLALNEEAVEEPKKFAERLKAFFMRE